MAAKPTTVDEYIAAFPKDVQQKLEQIRERVRKAVPTAEEVIKYGIPTYVFHGNMLSFAGFKKHLGIYPVPAGDAAFTKQLVPYRASKSTLQFPLDKPLPLLLITRVAKLRMKQMLEKNKKKKS